jgi:DNA repair protein RecN (Recombination protein N)
LRDGLAKKSITKLEEISISSLGVIESSNIEFNDGLTVLTGETGAGKTMVLTALGLVLGSKSDSDLVRIGAERATVTGRFAVNQNIASSITENGGQIEDGCAVITRTVSAQGKSRVLIGGALTSASFVADLSDQLVEIHQQSSALRLTKPNVVRELVDSFGGISLSDYLAVYEEFTTLQKRLSDLKSQLARRDVEIAELTEFVKVFSAVNPKPNEIELIENEISKLGSVEDINQHLSTALNSLENDEVSAINHLQQARKELDRVKDKDASLDLILDRYLELVLGFQDVTSDLTSYLVGLEADPKRFEFLQNRKSEINNLIKKFGKGSDRSVAYEQLIEDGNNASLRIEDLSGGDVRVKEIEQELIKVFNRLKKEGQKVSQLRAQAAVSMSQSVTQEIKALSMPNGEISIKCEENDPDQISSYTASGINDLEILFCSHQGGKELPLNKVASGGELSRVMLAMEVVIAQTQSIGTYIFDEVDAGVGGKAAIEIGRRLSKLSKNAQVIVITHLAQVAVWADHHLVVKKSEGGSVTQSDVISIDEAGRKVEIARMLSGQEDSQTAQQHASELLHIVRESVIS